MAKRLPYPFKLILKAILSPKYFLRIAWNDIRVLFGHVPGESKIIFVAGYPKSGTTWVENFVSNIPGYSPRVLAGSPEVLRQHGLPSNAFDRIKSHGYSAVKTHVSPDEDNINVLVKNGVRKVLVMYRDPRDIVVSHYYHVLKVNPWVTDDPWYADYSTMSKEDGLSHSVEVIADDYCAWVRGWRNVASCNPDVDCLLLRYEDLRKDPQETFRKILSFFGVKLSEQQFSATMFACESKQGSSFLSFGNPGKKSTKRKGLFGGWKKELNDEQKEYFIEKMGSLLIELEYNHEG